MHRRVVVAAFGAAALAPVAWLVTRPDEPPKPAPPTADERRAAELLSEIRLLALLSEAFPEDPILAAAHEIHLRQAAALQGVVGSAAVAEQSPPPGAPSTAHVDRGERILARKSLVSAVRTSDPEYAQLFSAVHASASQLVEALKKDVP